MTANLLKKLKNLCLRFRSRRKAALDDSLPCRIQKLISQGEYNGLSPNVRAEGAFVQYTSDGTYYRRVGLGITEVELLIVTEPLGNSEDEGSDPDAQLKIDCMFPLPTVLFILLDNRSKRFAVCTCVGSLMFFEMCLDEPKCDENWQRWKRVILLQTDENQTAGFPSMEAPSWQPVWSSPYIINLAEQNNTPAYEFLAKRRRTFERSLYFIQQPFMIRLVRHIGMQTMEESSLVPSRKGKGSMKMGITPGKINPQANLKSSAKTYLERLERNRAAHNGTAVSDPSNKIKNTIVLSPSGASGASKNTDTKRGNTRIHPKMVFERKNKILFDNEWIKANSTKQERMDPVKDIDVLILENRTFPHQRLNSFYGGGQLGSCPLDRRVKRHSIHVRKSCSCDDLLLTDEGEKISPAYRTLVYNWNSNTWASMVTSSEKILAKKYRRYTQKLRKQSHRRPLEMSSPTPDIGDIDDLVKEFSEKSEAESYRRTGRDLWMIAKRKLLDRRHRVDQLQTVVYSYFLKMSPKRYPKGTVKLTDLKPVTVALELFVVSRKLLLSVTAADLMNFVNNKGKLEVRSLSRILKFSSDVSRMVISQILDCTVILDRVDAICFFLEVSKYLLLTYHDYQSYMAVMRALMSLPVYRLQNTWTALFMGHPLYFSIFVCLSKVLSPAKGFRSYCSRIKASIKRKEPCIPWLEHLMAHCKRWPNSYGVSGERNKFIIKKTKVKKSKGREHNKSSASKKKSLPKPKGITLKPILQAPKIYEDPNRQRKAVQFRSKVDVAESQSGSFTRLRTAKVPLEAKIMEAGQEGGLSDEERGSIEDFAKKTATDIIADTMLDIKRRRTGQAKGKRYEKALGIYLKQKILADDDEEDDNTEHQKDDRSAQGDSMEKRAGQTSKYEKDKYNVLSKIQETYEDENPDSDIAESSKIRVQKKKGRLGIDLEPEISDSKEDQLAEEKTSRKRRMSVMEMKKQNRRMSLFEQAELNRGSREEIDVELAVEKRMQDMRRKGSIAIDLLQVENLKPMSRNNNYPERKKQEDIMVQKEGKGDERHKTDAADGKKVTNGMKLDRIIVDQILPNRIKEIGEHIDVLSLIRHTNNNNKNKLSGKTSHRRYRNEPKAENTQVPRRGWSDTLLYCSKPLTENKCYLCGNKECVFGNSLWKTFVEVQINALKCDVNSSAVANKYLRAAMAVSSRYSNVHLLKKSFNVEDKIH